MDRDATRDLRSTPGTAVVLGNLSIHTVPAAAKALRRAGCWFSCLPACLPALNPIEMAFAKLDAYLRRIGARTFDGPVTVLGSICEMFSPDERQSCLHYAGYAPTS